MDVTLNGLVSWSGLIIKLTIGAQTYRLFRNNKTVLTWVCLQDILWSTFSPSTDGLSRFPAETLILSITHRNIDTRLFNEQV